MSITINRLEELEKDGKGRNRWVETTVAHVNIGNNMHLIDFIDELVDEDENDVNYYTSTDNGKEWQVYGELVLKVVAHIAQLADMPVDEIFNEDGIGFNGKKFNISTQLYEIEVW